MARGSELRSRQLGLRSLSRMRSHLGRPVLPQALAHRFFLRELHDYRHCLEPAEALGASAVPEIRLLAESYRESAEMALGRAFSALACWYDHRPLFGAFERLRSNDAALAPTALEYLGHVLPHAVFKPVRRVFERSAEPVVPVVVESEAMALARWIRGAWESQDAWLRACAVRAARHVQAFDLRLFTATPEADSMVRAEIAAMSVRAPASAGQGASC